MTSPSPAANLRHAIDYLPSKQQKRVLEAIDVCQSAHAAQLREDGSPYSDHPIEVSIILAEWTADADTLIAGLLHDTLEDTELTHEEIAKQFGGTVVDLVEGVTKFTMADFAEGTSLDDKVETLRKLFEVMREDIRVVIIKLADRLHNVRTMESLDIERRKRFARETMQIYYRLAYHLGMNNVRRDLSQLCVPLIDPADAKQLVKRRDTDMERIEGVLPKLKRALVKHDEDKALIDIAAHTRSLQSMGEEHGNVRQGYVVILVARDVDACYELLKILHTVYQPISGTFEDHIAVPAESSYQSLRTSIIGPEGVIMPVRIRTADMDQQEQYGILLKAFKGQEVPGFSWLEQSEQLDKTTKQSSQAFWEGLQSDLFQKRIRMLVDGEEVFISNQATVLDAVYAAHESDAHRVIEIAKNGVRVEFSEPVNAGAVLNAKLGKRKHCQYEWLQYVNTSFARSLIVEALKERSRQDKIDIGRRLLQKESDYFHRGFLADVSSREKQRIALHFKRASFDDVLAMIGEGSLLAKDVFFQLFPKRKRWSFFRTDQPDVRKVRIRIVGSGRPRHDILPQVSTLARVYNVDILRTRLKFDEKEQAFELFLHGTVRDRIHYADFVSSLDQQHWITSVEPTLLIRELWTLALVASIPILATVTSIAAFPFLRMVLGQSPLGLLLLCLTLSAPIFIGNSIVLRVLRRYVLHLRNNHWIVLCGVLLNVSAILGLAWYLLHSGYTLGTLSIVVLSLLCILSLLFFLVFMTTFIHEQSDYVPLSQESWRRKVRQKFFGYFLRISAVIIWGLTPIIARYGLPDLPSTFIVGTSYSLSALLFVPVACYLGFSSGRTSTHSKEAYSITFWIAIIFNALTLLFIFAGAKQTIASNTELFLNFAPVIGLLVMFIFFRSETAYLKSVSAARWFFVACVVGCLGTAILIRHDVANIPYTQKLLGDTISLIAVLADVTATVALIRYAKSKAAFSGFHYIVRQVGLLGCLFMPVVLYHRHLFWTLGLQEWFLFIYLAIFDVFLAYLFAFVAYKKLDGLIVYLLFNLSSVITILVEVLFFDLSFSVVFALGALLVLGACVSAEVINSRCEKQGL